MKKLMSVLMAGVLACGLSVSAMAADVEAEKSDAEAVAAAEEVAEVEEVAAEAIAEVSEEAEAVVAVAAEEPEAVAVEQAEVSGDEAEPASEAQPVADPESVIDPAKEDHFQRNLLIAGIAVLAFGGLVIFIGNKKIKSGNK